MLDLGASNHLDENELRVSSQRLRVIAHDLKHLPAAPERRRERLRALQKELQLLALRLRSLN
jgi:hypothetical protein